LSSVWQSVLRYWPLEDCLVLVSTEDAPVIGGEGDTLHRAGVPGQVLRVLHTVGIVLAANDSELLWLAMAERPVHLTSSINKILVSEGKRSRMSRLKLEHYFPWVTWDVQSRCLLEVFQMTMQVLRDWYR